MNSWTSNKPSWNEKSIKLLLSISSLSPPVIVINPKKDEKFYNPAGEDLNGPAKVTYTQVNDDITIHVERKERRVKT